MHGVSSIETSVYAMAINYTKSLAEFVEFFKAAIQIGEEIEVRRYDVEKLSRKMWDVYTVYSIHPAHIVLEPKQGKKQSYQYRSIYENIIKGDMKWEGLTNWNRRDRMV